MDLKSCSSLIILLLNGSRILAADSAAVLFDKAATALRAQQYAEAETGFRSVLKLEPRNIGALGNLGVIYSQTHRYAQAIQVYQAALKVSPGDDAVLINLALAYVKQDRCDSAAPILEKLAPKPANLQSRELLASCRVSLAQYEQANRLLERLIVEEPDNPGILYIQGVALTRLKRNDEAHSAYQKMMAMVKPALANFLMGKASYETGDFEQAVTFFAQSLAADPHFPDAHRELGKTLTSLRRDGEAEAELRQAGSDDAEAKYFLGALFWREKPEEAAKLLTKAHDLTPDFWGPLYYLGRLNVERSHLDEGIRQLQQAAKLKPERSAIFYQLAIAYKRAGREAEAKAALAHVKNLNSRALQNEIDIIAPK